MIKLKEMKAISPIKLLHRIKKEDRQGEKISKIRVRDLEIKPEMINLQSSASVLRILRIVCCL